MSSKAVSPPRLNCRIGSLEKDLAELGAYIKVNWRIGSLEKANAGVFNLNVVNCRIGSLEIHTG